MGVSYYTCDQCSFGFRDDSEYYRYCDCGHCFCSIECGKLLNVGDYNEDTDSYAIDENFPITCIFCRKESYTTFALFQSLLKHYNLSMEDAVKIWKDQND